MGLFQHFMRIATQVSHPEQALSTRTAVTRNAVASSFTSATRPSSMQNKSQEQSELKSEIAESSSDMKMSRTSKDRTSENTPQSQQHAPAEPCPSRSKRALEDPQGDIREKEENLKNYKALYHEQIGKNDDLKDERRKLQSQNKVLRTKHEKVVENQLRLELTFEKLRGQNDVEVNTRQRIEADNRKLHNELEKCKSDLFKLQPSHKITASDVEGEFKRLCQSVGFWIGNTFSALDSLENSRASNPDSSIPKTPTTPSNVSDQIMEGCCTFPSLSEYVMQRIIFDFLEANLLSVSDNWIGITADERALLSKVYGGLEAIHPDKNIADDRYSKWLSEAVFAIDACADRTEEMRIATKTLSEKLRGILLKIYPALRWTADCLELLDEEIISPAANLKNLIGKTQPQKYGIYGSVSETEFFGPTVARMGVFQHFTVKDLRSRKTLSTASEENIRADERCGRLISIVEPGLVLCGEVNRVLHKPVAVILRDAPGKGRP